MARPKKNRLPEVTSAKIGQKVCYFVDGVGPKGAHVVTRGDSVKLVNPDSSDREMSYVGSAVKLMVEANS